MLYNVLYHEKNHTIFDGTYNLLEKFLDNRFVDLTPEINYKIFRALFKKATEANRDGFFKAESALNDRIMDFLLGPQVFLFKY